ncbi:T9SS type A sorting domain-containing protein [Psychroserpens ponticola]|uniref:T9SS type A sorting domain-containing protein n=1 Tax=Psychroserpens ponticola TaxID=2932268 RepID=A0ABY7S299_9FLAO|nr:T9SS type A sorting domain-containing protein [Psychroserpens ponticola]WCO03408.1 T9SS type A sorting domain-containing protein [Psychroserpens ponticola]
MKIKFYLCSILTISSFICCYSQIVNEGLLKIESFTDVYFKNDYTNATNGIHTTNGNLYLNHDFINNGITTLPTSGTTYFKSSNNTLLNISGSSNSINFYNLEINVTATNTKGVAVADNFEIIIEKGLNLINGNFRLLGESQLIQSSPANMNIIDSGRLLVDQQGYASAFKFNYWSSPVSDDGTFSLSESKFDGSDSSNNPFKPRPILFNSGSPYNGLPSVLDEFGNVVTALTINEQWVYKYLQGTGAYSDWVGLDQYSRLNPGEGYTMKGTNTLFTEQNYVYSGAPNNANYFLPINIGEQSLIGNPYPSAIDANKFINDNILLFDALYFWVDGGSTSHALTDYLGGYAIRNLTGGITPSIASPLITGIGSSGSVTAPSQYISIGQGFFVDSYGSGNIAFTNSQRVFVTESSLQSRVANQVESETDIDATNQYIRIGFEDTEGFHRQLLLGFLPNTYADINYNPGYDALLNQNRDDDMFFVIEDDAEKKYAIQGLNNFNDTIEVPLGILITNAENQQIMLDDVESFEHTVYLKDNVLNITHNLSESNYDVNLPSGNHLDRYSIVFQPQETLSITDEAASNIDVFYNGNKQIIVNNPKRAQIKNIKIFNVLGQEVLQLHTNLNNQNRIVIPFNNSNGIYLVKVETNKMKLTNKIINY